MRSVPSRATPDALKARTLGKTAHVMNPEFTSEGPLRSWAKNGTLEYIANTIQPRIKKLLEGDDAVHRAIRDLLHGTFFGHPLHPPLTDIPIGAWSVAAACDVLGVFGVAGYRDAAGIAIAVGAAGAVGAAVAGLADWSDTVDEPQRLGMLHGILNGAALTTYVVSLIARRRGAIRFGIFSGFTGYGLMSLAAYLGAELSFGMQLGVKHNAVPIDPPGDFVRVLDASTLNDGVMHTTQVGSTPLLVTRFDRTVRAVSGVCTHRGAPLADGRQTKRCVRCPWHGSRFSLEDGHVEEGPATFALTDYETQIAGGEIRIRTR
jgi:nitrite reductase/ring-hydroxylating ferredoxin subunit/uncharacterized membrane protein